MVVGIAVLLTSVLGMQPAGAAFMAGGLAMTGTHSPDPVFAAAQNPGAGFLVHMEMSGTAAGVFDGLPGACAIAYGADGVTNLVQGQGAARFVCNGSVVTGGVVSVTCSSPYLQVGSTVFYQGGICSGAPLTAPGQFTAVCATAYTAVNGPSIVTIDCEFTII